MRNSIVKITYLLLVLLNFSCYTESIITIEGDYSIEFVNDKKTVPVKIKIKNSITGADQFTWEFTGGNPTLFTSPNPPEITYTTAGNYTIKLKVTNIDGEEKVIEKSFEVLPSFDAEFSTSVIGSNNSPVEVDLNLTNPPVNNINYVWEFQDANIATYAGNDPPHVIFTSEGNHTIKLTASNGIESVSVTKTITVNPLLVANFNWTVNPIDNDYEAPVTIFTNNTSISASIYNWSVSGANPNSSNTINPSFTFNSPGTYSITLTASNDKTSQNITKNITVLPNTNLLKIENVKLGINAAHNSGSFGAFYSTITQQSYNSSQVNATNSSQIDIAFFGLNAGFSTNKFVSPNTVQSFGFAAIDNAQSTIFINSQDLCNCGLNVTESQFDMMTNDSLLSSLTINNSVAGSQEFGNSFPRIVLFKTQNGRKGAIKIKSVVQNGSDSYIICDIKVQKQ